MASPPGPRIGLILPEWKTVKANEVQLGQTLRNRDGTELLVTRIDHPFRGQEDWLAFIENTEQRFSKRPLRIDADVEVRRAD